LEKAIEIKRRAQRCIQNGDLDGALNEYEKLVQSTDIDPYNFVLLADLLYKKGDLPSASQRYLAAADAYEKAALYKNAIAVCKKMMRLSISASPVLERLARLHALDGLSTESALFYMQFGEAMVREDRLEDAVAALRKAYETSSEHIKALERLAEVEVMRGERDSALEALLEAAAQFQKAGLFQDADRCRTRADKIQPGSAGDVSPVPAAPPASAADPAGEEPVAETPPAPEPEPAGPLEPQGSLVIDEHRAAVPAPQGPPRLEIEHHGGMRDLPPSRPAAAAEPIEADEPATAEKIYEIEAEDVPAEAGEKVYEIDEDDLGGPPAFEPAATAAAVPATASPEARLDAMVAATESPRVPEPLHEAPVAAEAPRADEPPPGLAFDAPAAQRPPTLSAPEPAAAAVPEPERNGPAPDLASVERLLARAQEQFRSGDRPGASTTLVEAAREYDVIGQHDSAATIYRSLGKSPHAGRDLLQLWLRNCEQREDRREAAQVACELGDRALNEGQLQDARAWFERAAAIDPGNALSQRRLQRIQETLEGSTTDEGTPSAAVAAHPAASVGLQAPPEPPLEVGRVEVAVGRGEAVTFDLKSLVAEFQRGVQTQLSGDAQGHYDLGMTYREMGLLEQAVEAFRVAGHDTAFAHRSAEMIGRCYLDQGRFDDAAQEFMAALELPRAGSESGVDLRFQLGLAHEAGGRIRDALAAFEAVYSVQPSYPDAAQKIRMLRQALGSA
jgi:tetratricopeptide (TPR) repeat protein